MKHLIVVAHPAEGSFTMGLARAYAAQLEQLGHSQQILDLYRAKFNPVLSAAELLPASVTHPASADVARAQEEIRAADVLTVIYPLWWMSMPAMMKGYIDRVFAYGFAYEAERGVVRGLLAGKRAVLITVSGAPLSQLVESGRWGAAQVLQDTHMIGAAGFELLEHLHFDEIVPHLPSATAARHLEHVRARARALFGETSGGSAVGSLP